MVKTFKIFAVICGLIAFVSVSVAHAETKDGDISDTAKAAIAKQKEAAKKTHQMIKDLAADLDEQEQKHFYLAYSNYNLISTVEVVKTDVSKAVQACGKENPDMKSDLDKRFNAWSDQVSPIVNEAKANVNNMILAQSYAPMDEFKALFNAVDDTRALSNAVIDKVPVTSKDACEFLLKNMDDSEGRMLELLRQTLVSFPQAFPDSGASK